MFPAEVYPISSTHKGSSDCRQRDTSTSALERRERRWVDDCEFRNALASAVEVRKSFMKPFVTDAICQSQASGSLNLHRSIYRGIQAKSAYISSIYVTVVTQATCCQPHPCLHPAGRRACLSRTHLPQWRFAGC